MEIDFASSYCTPYGFEKLNDRNYATWAFDVKYQFLKEKLWGLVSGTEVAPTPPVRTVGESEADETRVSDDTTAQAAYQTALSEWNDKANAAFLILVTTILGRLQAPVRQATSPADAWNRLRDLYAPSGLQRRFALSRQLYSLHKEPSVSMQQHEITYDAIVEDLARAGKILDPEDLAITYLNTLPDMYSSLIQSMEPVLATLTSQNIKAKVREEEQRLKNVENGSSDHAMTQSITVAANTAQQGQPGSNSPKQARQKKKGKCHHCGLKGHWKNECRKRIAEERGNSNESGSAGNRTGNIGGTAMYSAALAIVANTAVAQKLLDAKSTETLWIFGSGANRQMFPHREEFLEYTPMVNSPDNVVGIGSSSLRVTGMGTVKIYDETGGFSILRDVLHVPQLKNGLLSVTHATDQGFETLITGKHLMFTDGNICIVAPIVNGLATTPCGNARVRLHAASARYGTKLCIWHEWVCHAAVNTKIKLTASGNVQGLPILGNPEQDAEESDVCLGCALGKIHRSPFPSVNNRHVKKGTLIHSDTCRLI